MSSSARQDAASLAAEKDEQASKGGGEGFEKSVENQAKEASSSWAPTTPSRGSTARLCLMSPTSASPLPAERRTPYPVFSPIHSLRAGEIPNISEEVWAAFWASTERIPEEDEASGLQQGGSRRRHHAVVYPMGRVHPPGTLGDEVPNISEEVWAAFWAGTERIPEEDEASGLHQEAGGLHMEASGLAQASRGARARRRHKARFDPMGAGSARRATITLEA